MHVISPASATETEESAMMRTEGIVLSRRASYNSDVFLTLFTEQYGKMDVIAKRSKSYRSPLHASTGVFVRSVFLLRPASVPVVSSADLVCSHFSLMEDYDSLMAAAYIAELVLKTTRENCAEREMYLLLRDVYHMLNRKTADPLLVRTYFLVQLCILLGVLSVEKDATEQTGAELRMLSDQGRLRAYDFSKMLRFFLYLTKSDLKNTRKDEHLFRQTIDICEVLLKEYLDIGVIRSREMLDDSPHF